jgi:hypothetical protein
MVGKFRPTYWHCHVICFFDQSTSAALSRDLLFDQSLSAACGQGAAHAHRHLQRPGHSQQFG